MEDYNNNGVINQSVSGENNQVAGRDFIIHAPGAHDDGPDPDNPNLITCPACDKYGVFRGADHCPSCHYSFLNARLAAQAADRQQRKQGFTILGALILAALVIAIQFSSLFGVSFWKGLGWGVMIAVLISGACFWLWVRFVTWNKLRRHK